MMQPFRLHGEDAADLAPGTWLLEASAGTGKTYTIVGIVLRLIVEQGIPIERFVLMTFTRAATAELRERLRLGLHGALAAIVDDSDVDDAFLAALASRHRGDETARRRLLVALAGLDAALVATIHGVCHRLLGDHALRIGAPLAADLDGDLVAWRAMVIHDLLRDWARRLSPSGASLAGQALQAEWLQHRCEQLERHPDVVLAGVEALRPEDIEARLDRARNGIAAWSEAIIAFYAERANILGAASVYQTRALRQRLQQVAAQLQHGVHAEQLKDLLRPVLVPNHDKERFNRQHLRALQQTEWFQGLSPLVTIEVGVQRWFLEAYAAALRERPCQSEHLQFQDLLTALDTALDSDRQQALQQAVADRYDVTLVDEFQDTDPVQWRILSKLFQGSGQRLFLIGDPKQAIYAFRGADVHAYLQVAGSDGLRAFTLERNFRSDADLIAAVNHLFDRGETGFVEEQIRFQPVLASQPQRLRLADGMDSRPLQAWWLEAANASAQTRCDLAASCAGEIVRLLAAAERLVDASWQPLQACDIAVLVRSHTEGRLIAEALAALPQPIACVRSMRSSVFASHTAFELASVLSAVLAPHRERSVRAAALTRLVGLTPADLLEEVDASGNQLVAALRELRSSWLAEGFTSAWQGLLDHGLGTVSPRVLLAGDQDGERSLTDLIHLGELLIQAECERELGPDALLAWLQAHIADPSRASDEQLQRLDRDDVAVRILTVHASKGLQFPVVFAPFLWCSPKPDPDQLYHQVHRPHWWLGSSRPKSVQTAQQRGALAETMRLTYVATTRAEHRLYLAFAPQAARGGGGGCTRSGLSWLTAGIGRCAPEQLAMQVRADIADGTMPGLWQQALAHPHIGLGPAPVAASVPMLQQSDTGAAVARTVADWQPLRRMRWFSSYSGLIRGRPVDEPDYDHAPQPEPSEDPLPRGARFGTALHAVFEFVDFHAEMPAILLECERHLTAQGFPAELAPALARLVQRVLHGRLPGLNLSLAVAAERRLAELEVLLPVAQPRELSEIFREHGGEWADYADDLLDLVLPSGYFTGIIDLVFSCGGRFFVLDWKSNDLAPRGGYHHAAMRAEMHHHHYVLQAHLYQVALHRYLRLRLRDYDYDRHLGPAWYAFVRGIDHSDHDSDAGWYQLRPSRMMIEALDGCFAEVPEHA